MALPDFALCVGINAYPGLTPLSGAEYDAADFHRWATSEGGVDPERARLIRSADFPKSALAAEAQPASQQIWAFFELIRQAARDNNDRNLGLVAGRRLYMFFSGHGFSPSIDSSGVLMANAERDTPHNLSAKAWAERFYENGLFEEVLLFQDACREPVTDVDLTPPYLKRSPMDGIQDRKRFYAFAARTPLLALEKPIEGQVRGVFAATLMAGLRGAARDPQSGAITAEGLKRHLVDNMKARLSEEELANDEIGRRPEVFDFDEIVILPPAAGAAAVGGAAESAAAASAKQVRLFPVEVALPEGAQGAQILDHSRQIVRSTGPRPSPWRTDLPIGLYQMTTPGGESCLFKVMGAVGSDGAAEVVHVP